MSFVRLITGTMQDKGSSVAVSSLPTGLRNFIWYLIVSSLDRRVGRTLLKIRWYTLLKNVHPRAWYTPILKTLTIVVVPSRLWLPLFRPGLSGAVLAQGP